MLLMMSANLVGFVLGVDGMKHFLWELTSTFSGEYPLTSQLSAGWAFVAVACSCLFCAVQVMLEYREEEKRRGIDRRC